MRTSALSSDPDVVDALSAALVAQQAYIERLERSLAKLNALAAAVQQATIRDHSIYAETPDEQWLVIDREDCERVLNALVAIDRWNPWTARLEPRLGSL